MIRYKNGRPLPEGILTTADAAMVAKRHKRTIITWITEGMLPAMKLPGQRGQYLIRKSDLDELLVELYTPKPYVPKEKPTR